MAPESSGAIFLLGQGTVRHCEIFHVPRKGVLTVSENFCDFPIIKNPEKGIFQKSYGSL